MSALIKACNKSASIGNSGSECSESMGPTAMLFAVPKGLTWTATNLAAFATFLNTQIHGPKANRVYPLFGPNVPIRKITLSKESDVIPVQDDGTPIFVRYGSITRAFGTTEGGICYAKMLQTLNKSGYSVLELDNANQILMRANTDGSFSALKTTFMYSPSPDFADFKNPSYTNFQITYRPEEYVGFGEIFQGDVSLSSLVGLLDVALTDATGSSTTKIKIGVQTLCAGTDLVAQLGAPLAQIANFVITAKVAGTVVTPTAAAIVGGHIELTGTFTSATVYTISTTSAAAWLTNGVDGYEGIQTVDITIP